MNEFDFDVAQRKRIARGARNKINGSKSTFCGLPSDHMTAAEIRKLNGKVKTYMMNDPMSYQDFKKMPIDLQEKYLRDLNSRFGVGATAISSELFNKSRHALPMYLNTHKIMIPSGKKLSAKERELWEAWLAGTKEEPLVVGEIEQCEQVIEQLPRETDELRVESTSICVTGEITVNALMKLFAGLNIPEGKCRVFIEIKEV